MINIFFSFFNPFRNSHILVIFYVWCYSVLVVADVSVLLLWRKPTISRKNIPFLADTQNPVLSGCPSDPVAVNRYTRANTLALPTATDNVYVSKYRIIDPVGSDTWPSEEYVLSRMTTFNVTATDHAGNTAHCVTVVGIIGTWRASAIFSSFVFKEWTSS